MFSSSIRISFGPSSSFVIDYLTCIQILPGDVGGTGEDCQCSKAKEAMKSVASNHYHYENDPLLLLWQIPEDKMDQMEKCLNKCFEPKSIPDIK